MQETPEISGLEEREEAMEVRKMVLIMVTMLMMVMMLVKIMLMLLMLLSFRSNIPSTRTFSTILERKCSLQQR